MSDTPRTDSMRGFHDLDTAVDAEFSEQLERELNAAQQRIKRLEGELESTKADRDSWSNQSDEFAKTAADLIIHIKRLEEAGDAMAIYAELGGIPLQFVGVVNAWREAKEDEP